MITDHPLFLSLFFFPLAFLDSQTLHNAKFFLSFPNQFQQMEREREMSTFSRANALCKYHICSPGWQGAWQPRMPASLA